MYVLHKSWANTIYPNIIFRVLEHDSGVLAHTIVGKEVPREQLTSIASLRVSEMTAALLAQ